MPASSQARNSRAPSPLASWIKSIVTLRSGTGVSRPRCRSPRAHPAFSQHQQGGGFSQSFFLVAQLALKFLDLFLISQALLRSTFSRSALRWKPCRDSSFQRRTCSGVKPFSRQYWLSSSSDSAAVSITVASFASADHWSDLALEPGTGRPSSGLCPPIVKGLIRDAFLPRQSCYGHTLGRRQLRQHYCFTFFGITRHYQHLNRPTG